MFATCAKLISQLSTGWFVPSRQKTHQHIKTIPLIKGNVNKRGKKIYHVPDGYFYDRTNAVEYFHSEEEAIAAGYKRSQR